MSAPARAYFQALIAHEAALWDAVDRRLADAGVLRVGRLAYLRILDTEVAVRIQDVADRLGITVGAASRFTDRMVTDALVERTPNPEDRRSSCVSLTAHGRASLRAAEAVFDAALDTLLADSDQDLPGLTARLNQLRDTIARRTDLQEVAE